MQLTKISKNQKNLIFKENSQQLTDDAISACYALRINPDDLQLKYRQKTENLRAI